MIPAVILNYITLLYIRLCVYVYAILSTVSLFSFTGPCNFPSKNKLPKQQEIGESNHVTLWCHGRAKKPTNIFVDVDLLSHSYHHKMCQH